MVPGSDVPADLREPFEDAHHARPILGQEHPRLLLHLLVVKPAREDRRRDDPQH